MDILTEDYFEDSVFNDLKAAAKLVAKSFYNCTFKNCDFNEADFSDTLFSECIFISSNLSLALLKNTKLQDVRFEDCKILGVDFTVVNPLIIEIGFKNSQISKCNFSGLELVKTGFIDCTIHNSDFFEANLSEAQFSGCDLRGSLFESTNLSKADFRTAFNYAINPLINKLKNAQFSLPEAVTLLKAFEIKVKQPD